MADAQRSYRSEFWRSPHHIVLGLSTLGGAVLASAPSRPWPLLLGAAAYALGWIYLPDSGFFRRAVDRHRQHVRDREARARVEAFRQRAGQMLAGLSATRREKYATLLAVCRDIERATTERPGEAGLPDDPHLDVRLKKLEELAWTYLRLLSIEDAQERFLEVERREDLPREIVLAEEEAARLQGEVSELRRGGPSSKLDAKERLFQSCLERLEVLRKRVQRCEDTRENVELIGSEQARLVQQVKLIRADAIATKNAEGLSSRIDATIEHLNETNKWLAGLEEYKDLVGSVPDLEHRIGFDEPPAAKLFVPPLPASEVQARAKGGKQRNKESQ